MTRPTGRRSFGALLATFALGACASQSPAPAPERIPSSTITPAEVMAAQPSWRDRYAAASVGSAVLARMREAPRETDVVVLFGAWCPDSEVALPVIWKAFDAASEREGTLPFDVTHVDVDRSLTSDEVDVGRFGLLYVPTVIVYRDGEETGRIVESAPNDLLADFADLLHGRQQGVLTGRSRLGATSFRE